MKGLESRIIKLILCVCALKRQVNEIEIFQLKKKYKSFIGTKIIFNKFCRFKLILRILSKDLGVFAARPPPLNTSFSLQILGAKTLGYDIRHQGFFLKQNISGTAKLCKDCAILESIFWVMDWSLKDVKSNMYWSNQTDNENVGLIIKESIG